MITLILTRCPWNWEETPVFPPLEYAWNPDKQRSCWRELLAKPDVYICWSQILIEYLGAMVEEGKLDRTQIEILFDEGGTECSHKSTYDERGVLENWQFGWFSGDSQDYSY